MKKYIPHTLFVILMLCIAAAGVTPGLKISQYPNTGNPADGDLYILASAGTNKNISHSQLRLNLTNGLATTGYVNSVSATVSNGVVTLVTLTSNGLVTYILSTSNALSGQAGFANLEMQTNGVRLGLGTNQNWTYGLTGSVSGTTFTLGIDDSTANNTVSNGLLTIINTLSNAIVSANVFRTNQWTTNLSDTPVNGKVWFQGFPSQAFVTNNARNRTWEWNPTNQSMIIGSVGNLGVVNHTYIATSNFFDFPNVGYMSTIRGTSCLANADFAFVNGDRSTIYTNAHNSFIAAGSASQIRTNASNSFIGAGVNCVIHVNSGGSFIGSGQDHFIDGGSPWSTIAGGFANQITSGGNSYATIGGGLNNTIGTAAGRAEKGTIGGGELNVVRGDHATVGGGRANNMQGVSDFSTIAGGNANTIGSAGNGATRVFIGGGESNLSDNDTEYSVIAGGRSGTISGGSSNAFIGGGFNNTINANNKFSAILGGERNTINAKYAVAIGTSNTVTADYGIAIGTGVNVTSGGTVVIGNASQFSTSVTVSGAGSGSTNYTLQAINQKMNMGSSNVNIVAVMQTTAGQSQRWRVAITNDSPDTWGFSASSVTNRWFWQSYMYGTNAPAVLTNNTRLVIDGESEGTNTWAEFKYYTPAK